MISPNMMTSLQQAMNRLWLAYKVLRADKDNLGWDDKKAEKLLEKLLDLDEEIK